MAKNDITTKYDDRWYWTGSLMAFVRVVNLRVKPDSARRNKNDCFTNVTTFKRPFPH